MRVTFEHPPISEELLELPTQPVHLVADQIRLVGTASRFKREKDGSLSAELQLTDIEPAELKTATYRLVADEQSGVVRALVVDED